MAKVISMKPGLQLFDVALYLKDYSILVFGDVHIGYEEALNKQGILVPRFQFEETMKRIKRIIESVQRETRPLATIIINGDLKHEFGDISDQEWKETLQFLDFLTSHCNEIILIRGNHDTILGPIARKRNVKIVEYYVTSDSKILFTHGDKILDPFPICETIVMSNEHPAIALRDGVRSEVYKCFLKGTWKGHELIVLPSFSVITEGTDIIKEKLISPYLHQNLDSFEVFVVADLVYKFGTVSLVKKMGR